MRLGDAAPGPSHGSHHRQQPLAAPSGMGGVTWSGMPMTGSALIEEVAPSAAQRAWAEANPRSARLILLPAITQLAQLRGA